MMMMLSTLPPTLRSSSTRASSSSPLLLAAASLLLLSLTPQHQVAADCLSDPALNAEFVPESGDAIPLEGSCCQADVCGLACPEPVSAPGVGTYNLVVSFFSLSR